MTKLNYDNYLKDQNFDIDEEYYKLFKYKESKFKKFKKEYPYCLLFHDIEFKEIVYFDKDLILKIESRIIEQLEYVFDFRKQIKERLEQVFNYEGKNQGKKITPFFTKNFNFRTCFYCNKDFITNFESEKEVSTFQLDHFYDKATYPYLALSFYNLIPSCYVCNAKVKGSENCFKVCIPPNDENFNFENKVKFKLLLDKDCKNLHVQDKEDIDVPLKEQFSNEYDKYIEIFKLNERYKAHKDIVYEMITKAELYPESRLKELQNLTGIPFQQIKKDIFNLSDEKDLSKKPFSKLIKDMSEELGLV